MSPSPPVTRSLPREPRGPASGVAQGLQEVLVGSVQAVPVRWVVGLAVFPVVEDGSALSLTDSLARVLSVDAAVFRLALS